MPGNILAEQEVDSYHPRMKLSGLRSPYEKTRGILYFARMIDKIRLHDARDLPAEYQPNLGKGFDGRCVNFLKITYDALVERVRKGGTDDKIIDWCFQMGRQPTGEEIEIWNDFMRKRGWNDEAREILQKRLREGGHENRKDILTMFDYIDVDEGRELRTT